MLRELYGNTWMFTVFEMVFCTFAEIDREFAPLLAVSLLA